MAQTLSSNNQTWLKFGVAIGYNAAKMEQPERLTVSEAKLASASDSTLMLLGRYDNNPRWADFPKWLKEYRTQMNQQEPEREFSRQD